MHSVVVSQSVVGAIHCINPDCPSPASQPWGNKFCSSCGAPLLLNDRYVPLHRLGTGGFATIYTVWDLQNKIESVLKVLLEPSPKAQELFEQEAAVLASLHHPGVPKVEPDSFFVVNLGAPAGRHLPCLVMEKINGPTLQDILDEHPQGCSESAVRNWLGQALDILRELHRRQIIHRDIKPSNLMLRQQTGQLVAIDFGGVKQISLRREGQKASSTRLISPGYSPPEQIAGGAVGPAADFYALGMTIIQLLTGQYPPDLEDPVNGKLRWRDRVRVSPDLANLLDEMVQPDAQRRPATADEIEARLAGASAMKTRSLSAPPSLSQVITKVARNALFLLWVVIVELSKALGTSTLFLLRVVTTIVKACLDTVWEMFWGGVGALLGTATGYWLAYSSPFGARTTGLLAQHLPRLVGDLNINIEIVPIVILFALAGLGTAVGLNEAGGFDQRKFPLVTAFVGILSYSLASLVWYAAPFGVEGRLVSLIAVAVSPLILALGLPSHHLVHAFVSTIGTSALFATIVSLDTPLPNVLLHVFSPSRASWPAFGFSILFFCLLAITTAFCLGVSYYLIVPFLRWLGWR